MIIKLAIVGIILIVGGVLIFPEQVNESIQDSTTENMANQLSDLKNNSERTIDELTGNMKNTINDIFT